MQPDESTLPIEFDLALACVRWPHEPENAARIQRLCSQAVDWAQFLRILGSHQVAPLAFHNLEASAAQFVPSDILANLKASTIENTRVSFQGISELIRLIRLFRDAAIELRVLKGPPLAIAAFGSAALRTAGDIDLLIDENSLDAAHELLRREGYLLCEPAAWPTPRRMRSYIAHQKDFSYQHERTGLVLDLHWRLLRNRYLPISLNIQKTGLSWMQLGPESIPVLPKEQLFLYLCVHGALDGWLRLKWLADIGALLSAMPIEEVRQAAYKAKDLQVLPEFSAALLLCHQKLGSENPPSEALGPKDPRMAHILRTANRLMSSNHYCPVREKFSTTIWFKNELVLAPTFQSKREILARSLFRPRVWQWANLPDFLFPLYAFISPLEWIRFRVRRFWARVTIPLRKLNSQSFGSQPRSNQSNFFHAALPNLAIIVEAATLLTLFRVALKFVPVQRLTAWMVHGDSQSRVSVSSAERNTLRKIEWAIGAVVRHAPMTYVCFPQSLAAYFMLHRRRIQSKLFYGVAREDQKLTAHTWIKVGDRTIVGGETESRFTVLAVFP
jgi:hypothetical protein